MLTLRYLDDKVLTQKAKRVASIDDTIRSLCASMVSLMLEKGGIGLSANQVGVLKRIIVVLIEDTPVVMINPEILESSKEICEMEEGCLSIPEEFLKIKRPKTIKIKYRNTKGMPCVNTYYGLTSRIIQHEIDHLNGVMMNTK